MKTQFEKGLKDKLQSFEPNDAVSNWNGLKNQLPKPGISAWTKALIFAGAVVVTVGVVVLLTNPNESEETNNISQNIIEKPVEQSETTSTENVNTESLNNADNITESTSSQTHAQTVSDEVYENVEIPEKVEPQILSESIEPKNEHESEVVQETLAEEVVLDTNEDTIVEDHADSAYNSGNENSKPEQVVKINASVEEGCVPLTVTFTTNASAENYDFMWHFKDGTRSTEVAPVHTYSEIGEYTPVLILTPVSEDYYRQRVTGSLISCYGIPETEIDFVKLGNLYTFNTINRGDIVYNWKLDNQSFDVASFDYEFKYDGSYDVNLFLKDDHGCTRDVSSKLNVKIEHNFAMPNAFTPNEPGVNSHFGPVFSEMEDLSFTMIILDKYNQVVFETDDINKPWDGLNIRTNQDAEAGVYLWKIVTEDRYGNVRTRRGQVTLLRK